MNILMIIFNIRAIDVILLVMVSRSFPCRGLLCTSRFLRTNMAISDV